MSESKIKCPKCEWEPDGRSYWLCDECNTSWNTFDTYGKCPSCGHVHRDTQCPPCRVISPHVEWYVDLDNMDLEEVLEKCKLLDIRT